MKKGLTWKHVSPFGVTQVARKYNKLFACILSPSIEGYEQLYNYWISAIFSKDDGSDFKLPKQYKKQTLEWLKALW